MKWCLFYLHIAMLCVTIFLSEDLYYSVLFSFMIFFSCSILNLGDMC